MKWPVGKKNYHGYSSAPNSLLPDPEIFIGLLVFIEFLYLSVPSPLLDWIGENWFLHNSYEYL